MRLAPAVPDLALPGHVVQSLHGRAADAAHALAERVGQVLDAALKARGVARLAVSGGRSPVACLEALSRTAIDWSRVTVTLVDERWVDEAHADSNARLVQTHLLQGPAAAARWISLRGAADAEDIASGRRRAEDRLRALSGPFDAIVLGVGDDGHTASLFAGAPGLAAALDPSADAMLTVIDPPAAPHRRLSLTLRVLLEARQLFVLASGATKRARLEEAAREPDGLRLPVAAVLHQRRAPVQIFWAEQP